MLAGALRTPSSVRLFCGLCGRRFVFGAFFLFWVAGGLGSCGPFGAVFGFRPARVPWPSPPKFRCLGLKSVRSVGDACWCRPAVAGVFPYVPRSCFTVEELNQPFVRLSVFVRLRSVWSILGSRRSWLWRGCGRCRFRAFRTPADTRRVSSCRERAQRCPEGALFSCRLGSWRSCWVALALVFRVFSAPSN